MSLPPSEPAPDVAAALPDPVVAMHRSRAGRDLPTAIGVGLALGGLAVAALVIVKAVFVGVVVLGALIGIWELTRALATGPTRVPLVPVSLGGVSMVVGSYLGGTEVLSVALALSLIGCLVWRLAGGADGYLRDAAAGVFVLSYVPLLGAFIVLLLAEDDGAWRVATFVLVATASDIGGFAVGVLFGRHAMAPSISPKKSWEGFAGSVATCMLVGWVTVSYALDGRWWVGLLLGAVAALVATLGDLAESLIKRDLGIKDMGNLLPGHGGIMDRLDSLLAVAPVVWLILTTLVAVR